MRRTCTATYPLSKKFRCGVIHQGCAIAHRVPLLITTLIRQRLMPRCVLQPNTMDVRSMSRFAMQAHYRQCRPLRSQRSCCLPRLNQTARLKCGCRGQQRKCNFSRELVTVLRGVYTCDTGSKMDKLNIGKHDLSLRKASRDSTNYPV